MGRFQQLRAKAISLRGAIAIGGALVIAASMAQASGTLAQSTELREAKAGIATQNYFPTPLPSDISCSTSGLGGSRRANVSWTAPVVPVGEQPIEFKYRVTWSLDANSPKYSFETGETSTGQFRISDKLGGAFDWGPFTNKSYRIFVQTINPHDTGVVSTGSVSWTVHSATSADTYCTGSSRYHVDNQPWENQYDWDPDVIPFSVPSPSFFGGLFDEDASADLLGDLPEGNELTSLDDAALDASPDGLEQATSSPSSTPIKTTSSSPTSSKRATTPTSPATTSAGEEVPAPTTSERSTSSSPTVPTSSADASPTSVKSTPSSSAPAAPSTTAQQSVRAGVGDGPVAVGASKARLDEVDGRTRLSVTRGGSEVCTAEVDGASRLESSGGVLTVTVSGRSSPVDLETCELA